MIYEERSTRYTMVILLFAIIWEAIGILKILKQNLMSKKAF